MPDGHRVSVDLTLESAFRDLRLNARFQALRHRILDHVAREQIEVRAAKVDTRLLFTSAK